jgi:hypothetical protein
MSTLPPFRLAIPKKGRLYDKCSKVLEGAGLEYRREARLDVAGEFLREERGGGGGGVRGREN